MHRVWLMLPPLFAVAVQLHSDDGTPPGDPAGWGGDHVGRPLPVFTTGDQCLFCHRDVGANWSANRHGRTVRFADPDSGAIQALLATEGLAGFAGDVEYVTGDSRRQRFLKSGDVQGRLDMLSVEWAPPAGDAPERLLKLDAPHWDANTFGDSCAGCHATAVDSKSRRFEETSLDCFVCHGEPPEDHTERPELARFSKTWERSAREEISVCGQCHLRGGRSRSSGLPYSNNFVAGDNLFLDVELDLSDEALAAANPADRHVLENVRDVVRGEEGVTCRSCHDVHDQSSRKHHRLRSTDICLNCHNADGPKRRLREFEVHSSTCGY
jgi:predicted CXXCH cytochrome family protein